MVRPRDTISISLVELAANSNLYIVISLVVQFEISVVFLGRYSFMMMKIAWTNGRHSTNIHI